MHGDVTTLLQWWALLGHLQHHGGRTSTVNSVSLEVQVELFGEMMQ